MTDTVAHQVVLFKKEEDFLICHRHHLRQIRRMAFLVQLQALYMMVIYKNDQFE